MEEYIKLLELPGEFDLSDLKKAYRQKVLKYHPDKATNEAERIGYEALMKKLNEANDYLKEYLENHGGKYTKATENDTSNFEEDIHTEDNSKEEETEEPQNSEYDETKEQPKPNESNESISKIKNWIEKNPKKFAIIAIIYILLLFFVIWLCNLDSGYTPQAKVPTNQQANTVQNTQEEQTKKPKIPTVEDTQSKDNQINAYMNRLHRRIKRNWDLPSNINEENIRVKLGFKLDKNGQLIENPYIKQSSGNERIDQSCINAVMLTAPFGVLPECINQDTIDMEMFFEADKRSN